MCLWCPITKRVESIIRILVCLILWMNSDSSKLRERKAFHAKQSINIMYPNKENMFRLANHKTNGDYYKNPCLSYLMNEH